MKLGRKKNITYWFNYCKKHNIQELYLLLDDNSQLHSQDNIQQYRIKYYEDIGGYVLEVFSDDRFVYGFFTSSWNEREYINANIEDIEKKEKFIIKNGQWVHKDNLTPEPIDYNKQSIQRELTTRNDGENVIYYDFSNNKLQ